MRYVTKERPKKTKNKHFSNYFDSWPWKKAEGTLGSCCLLQHCHFPSYQTLSVTASWAAIWTISDRVNYNFSFFLSFFVHSNLMTKAPFFTFPLFPLPPFSFLSLWFLFFSSLPFFFVVLINVTLSINVLVPHAILMVVPPFSCLFRIQYVDLIVPCAL